MKKFDIPVILPQLDYIGCEKRPENHGSAEKDYSPSVLDFGPVQFLIARHFGFCYGVENAIEIAYKTR